MEFLLQYQAFHSGFKISTYQTLELPCIILGGEGTL